MITGIKGLGGEKKMRKSKGRTSLRKTQWPKIPGSHPQPSPWSRSEELDRFCTRVFKKSNHNKVDLASFKPLGSRLSLRPVLPLRQFQLSKAFTCPGVAFPWSVNTKSEAASQSGPCVHPDSIVECRAPRAERDRRGRPCPGSPHIGQGNRRIPRVLPPFSPPPQLRWRGSSCHQSLCW